MSLLILVIKFHCRVLTSALYSLKYEIFLMLNIFCICKVERNYFPANLESRTFQEQLSKYSHFGLKTQKTRDIYIPFRVVRLKIGHTHYLNLSRPVVCLQNDLILILK